MSKELRDRLLLQAARHIRSRGYAAFSYADLSRENGVSKATVHHYFRTKEELGAARGELFLKISSRRAAVMLLAALEGGAFIGWGMSQPEAGLTAYDDAVAGLAAA